MPRCLSRNRRSHHLVARSFYRDPEGSTTITGRPSERSAPQLENIVALQRCELQRLHLLVDELRAKPDAGDLARRLQRAQSEVRRQWHRAEMWRKRAGG